MNVLIICEDFRNDQYVLAPVIKQMFIALGKPRAKIVVCKNPLIQGISQALNLDKISEIIERYQAMTDLFLLCVDRDGNDSRCKKLEFCEKQIYDKFDKKVLFIAENAWQELEVWILAGHDKFEEWRKNQYSWQDIRAEPNPKELYYQPFAKFCSVWDHLGGGRKLLGEEAAKNYERIRRLCQEDVLNLENRIKTTLT
jgi:hypothetical protein